MNRRQFLTRTTAAAFSPSLLTLIGCPVSQNDASQLASLIGTAAASLETILGNSSVAQQLLKASGILSTDIANWKQGDDVQMIIQGVEDLEEAINLIPLNPDTQLLIDLLLGTAQSLLSLYQASGNPVNIATRVKVRVVVLTSVPRKPEQLKKQWNAEIAKHPQFAGAKLI